MPINKCQLMSAPGGPVTTGAVKSGNGISINPSTGAVSLNPQQTLIKLSAGTNVSLSPASGVGVVTITNTLALPTAGEDFPPGTRMIFANSSAPLGWTTVGEYNNLAVRLNNSGGGTTNNSDFTSIFTSYTTNGNATLSGVSASGSSSTYNGTYSGSVSLNGQISDVALSGAQNANHTHGYVICGESLVGIAGGPNLFDIRIGTEEKTSNGLGPRSTHTHSPSISAGFSGAGNSHSHTVSGSVSDRQVPLGSGNTINLSVQYLDFLTCSLS